MNMTYSEFANNLIQRLAKNLDIPVQDLQAEYTYLPEDCTLNVDVLVNVQAPVRHITMSLKVE